MSLYKRINNKKVDMPVALGLAFGQAIDIEHNATSVIDAIWIGFKFGYMQGQRSIQFKGRRETV